MNYYTSVTTAMSSLSPNALKILLFLQEKANRATGSSFWRKSKIAGECHISLSSFSRGLRELKGKNLVTVRERYESGGRQKSNEYFVSSFTKSTTVQPEARQLGGSAYKVYLYLTQKCGKAALYAVKKSEIATACNLSLSTVKAALKRLKIQHYISSYACTEEDNRPRGNRYRISDFRRRLHNLKVILCSLLKNLTPSPGSTVTPLGTLSKLKLTVRKKEREDIYFRLRSKTQIGGILPLLINRAKEFLRLLC